MSYAILACGFAIALISAVVFWPFLRQTRSERWVVLAVVMLVPLLATLAYEPLGAREDLAITQAVDEWVAQLNLGEPLAAETQNGLIQRITRRAEQTNNDSYWLLLASHHMANENFVQAARSYRMLSQNWPNQTAYKASWAEAQFMADGYQLSDTSRRLINQVLAQENTNPTALGILGIAEYRNGDYQAAIDYWQLALSQLPADGVTARTLRSSIGSAQQQLALLVSPEPETSISEPTPLEPVLRVLVALADDLVLAPDTSVFVFARQSSGPPMPVVVSRYKVSDLPIEVTLDDSQVMIPGTRLADYPALDLVARTSMDGSVTGTPEDYEVVISGVAASLDAERHILTLSGHLDSP